mmetsp:Transcript_4028/g.7753  ORF Transcript_4028/g.7753 Transcript_4028/m.7753 type:complete len:153 (+) Transcript_4028:459-917(+)
MILSLLLQSSVLLHCDGESLLSSINLFDLVTSKTPVSYSRLFQVAQASLFIAAKLQNQDFDGLTGRVLALQCSYSQLCRDSRSLFQFERTILDLLKWNIYTPTSYAFLTTMLTHFSLTEPDNLCSRAMDLICFRAPPRESEPPISHILRVEC